MEEEKKALITKLITDGATRLEAKSTCIGEGYGSSGVDELYTAVLNELGVPEPKDTTTALQATGERTLSTSPTHSQIKKKRSQLIVFCVILAICALVVFFGIKATVPLLMPTITVDQPIKWGEKTTVTTNNNTTDFSDGILQAKVESTFSSAKVQAGRMGSLDGVCRDISVVAPVDCTQSPTSLAVFVALSNNTFFCIDKGGFSGNVPIQPKNAGSCK